MKKARIIIAAVLAGFSLVSCEIESTNSGRTGSEDVSFTVNDIAAPADAEALKGALLMNNGNWGSNDASFTLFDPESGSIASGLFSKVNNRAPGDLGQDMIQVGDRLFIAMNGSKIIFVTDLSLRILKTVEAALPEGAKLSPRRLADARGKVYVTYYEGYVAEIDPTSFKCIATPVGNSPEGLAYAGGKLYVANSGGALYPDYENSISVIDISKFCETEKIEVNLNPQSVVADAAGNNIYVSSFGNYEDVPALLQKVDLGSREVTDLGYSSVKAISAGPEGTLYVVCGSYDENWKVLGNISKFDMAGGKDAGLLTEDSVMDFYSISYSNGYVFVGTSDYTTDGVVRMYDTNGKMTAEFDAAGLNPQKAIYL